MKTLIINAHPLPHNASSYSNRMEEVFIREFRARFSPDDLEILNLAEAGIPRLDAAMLGLWDKQAKGEALSKAEQALNAEMSEIMAQFKRCRRIVITMPLHNFNVTSVLKDYIDNILIARETFRYTSGGSEGLMTDGRKVMLLQSSGSVYTNSDRYTPLEYSRMYLDSMFTNIMGFSDFRIIRMQGTSVSAVDKDQAFRQAEDEIRNSFSSFYG